MPDQPDSALIQEDAWPASTQVDEVKTRADDDSPEAAHPGDEDFLATLSRVWEVPVEETGMAVTFDTHRQA